MRITGGALRGRRVRVPEGVIRPSMDQMRESVFACLGDLSGRSFLDLFSGSGIIALEAASRGAAPVEAVENDPLKRKTLLQNVAISPARIHCRFISAELYVQRAKGMYDLIFLDPPFPYQYKWELLGRIASSALVSDESIIMLHRPRKDNKRDSVSVLLDSIDSREYGRSVVDFFRVKPRGK
ncbi:MAG: RsmD family RNA methyltransferase [Treponema sp.]|nr:RsmD family RNA methyltransferase [Treponema sp.]